MVDPQTKPAANAPAKKPQRSMGPFDHPWFLPGLLYFFMLWAGYDEFLNPDFDPKHMWFNRTILGLSTVFAVYYTVQNLRDARRARERAAEESQAPSRTG